MPRRIVDLPSRRAPTPAEPIVVAIRRLPADAVVPMHSHACGQLAYPVRGAVCLDVPGSRWLVPPFRAVWVPPAMDHELALLGRVDLRIVHIEPSVASLPVEACVVVEIAPLLRELIESLAVSPTPRGRRREQIESLLLTELGCAKVLDLRLPQPVDRRLRALCDALMENPADNAPLGEWAKRVGASERTLSRLFQSEMGMSFGLWRQQVRLTQATVLAAQGRSYGEIAGALGYASPSAFSAMFRRALGVSPRAFFEAGRAGRD